MKKILITLLASLIPLTLQAALYKGFDEEGNVTYSDTPFNNAEKITPPHISVVDSPKAKEKPVEPKNPIKDPKAEITHYKHIAITSPKHQTTFWNNDKLSISLSLSPALNTSIGDVISIRMDGQTIIKKSKSLQHEITVLDRGEHKIQAVVRNKKGKIIKQSKVVTIYIKKSFIKKSPR